MIFKSHSLTFLFFRLNHVNLSCFDYLYDDAYDFSSLNLQEFEFIIHDVLLPLDFS